MLRRLFAVLAVVAPAVACTPKSPDVPDVTPLDGPDVVTTDAPDATVTPSDGAPPSRFDAGVDCAPFGAQCTRNASCCSENCAVGGTCGAPRAILCNVDADCPSAMICQTCNHACVFRPGGSCDLGAPCPCGYYCSAGTCDPIVNHPAAQCVSDGDCPIDQFCNRAIFACQVPMFITYGTHSGCNANTDCPAGQICSDANGTRTCASITTVPCITVADCPDGMWQCDSLHQCIQYGC